MSQLSSIIVSIMARNDYTLWQYEHPVESTSIANQKVVPQKYAVICFLVWLNIWKRPGEAARANVDVQANVPRATKTKE